MILIDTRGRLVSTRSEKELHKFAEELSLRKGWFIRRRSTIYGAHYDTMSHTMYNNAVKAGAKEVTPEELANRAWWHTKRKETKEPTEENQDIQENDS